MANINTSEARLRRKAIRDEAKKSLVGEVLSHPFFPHDIYINMSGVKEWLNQPHKKYMEKNEALLQLPQILLDSEYLGAYADPKGREYIRVTSGSGYFVTFTKCPEPVMT